MAAQNTYISLVCGAAVLVFCSSGAVCAPLCLAGDFDSQLQHILQELMIPEQDPSVTRVLDDVRTTLDQRWQGYELIVAGSVAAGLGTKASDIDLAVRLPNNNASTNLYVLQETEKLFNKQPELYSHVKIVDTINKVATILQFNHIPSKRSVDILMFDPGNYVATRKVIEYYFKLDKRFQFLGVFLKYWFRIHKLTGRDRGSLPGYAMYLLIIFYLQQKNMVPPGYVLQVNATPHFNNGSNVVSNELPYSTTNTENLHQLLGGFFKYYSEFNFDDYIVSPLAGRPIPKNLFTIMEKLSKKYTLFNKLTTMLLVMKKRFVTEVSVQDVLEYEHNAAYLTSHELVTKLKYLMKSVATKFEELPSDKILSAILDADEQNCIEIVD
ncbi:hypothetical protein PYW08_012041 [Mythimna loreyi]|uniref:Uncharacterized protein n=1 Tax=Mythimna loreyi TaxID=667449 RepID=A0ACC2QL63_9NEOP|nr:hypothetical protein PYW08_012041 [Mythimna loreyi]